MELDLVGVWGRLLDGHAFLVRGEHAGRGRGVGDDVEGGLMELGGDVERKEEEEAAMASGEEEDGNDDAGDEI